VSIEHIFSVDVEEHFQVYAFDPYVDRATWDSHPSRVERNTDLILDLLAKHGHTATFFTLGWVAQRNPALVRRIVSGGHEIASHGWWHRKVVFMTPDDFLEDVRASKEVLEQISGQAVIGFRAPSFSITPGYEWAFDMLLEAGYRYDSSLFPIERMNYGYPRTPPIPHLIHRPNGDIMEFPLATTRIAGRQIPAAGGGYFRHFPYGVTRRAFREHSAANMPGMFYIHPWEVDPDQPRLDVPMLTRVRHYRNIDKTAARLDRLMGEFRFTSVAKRLSADTTWIGGTGTPAAPARPRLTLATPA